jgi:hypothetical protein
MYARISNFMILGFLMLVELPLNLAIDVLRLPILIFFWEHFSGQTVTIVTDRATIRTEIARTTETEITTGIEIIDMVTAGASIF